MSQKRIKVSKKSNDLLEQQEVLDELFAEWVEGEGRTLFRAWTQDLPGQGFTKAEFNDWFKSPEIQQAFRAYGRTRIAQIVQKLEREGKVYRVGDRVYSV